MGIIRRRLQRPSFLMPGIRLRKVNHIMVYGYARVSIRKPSAVYKGKSRKYISSNPLKHRKMVNHWQKRNLMDKDEKSVVTVIESDK